MEMKYYFSDNFARSDGQRGVLSGADEKAFPEKYLKLDDKKPLSYGELAAHCKIHTDKLRNILETYDPKIHSFEGWILFKLRELSFELDEKLDCFLKNKK